MTIPNYCLWESISYRLISFVITFTVTYLVTGSLKAALAIGPIDQIFKFGVYYYHRRAWDQYSSSKITEYWAEVDEAVYGPDNGEDDDE